MSKYLWPWMDTTMHGKPWWKVHVWPHVVGGAALGGLLSLPWWTIDTLAERVIAVVVFQGLWELSQVVTWARRPWLRLWAWLWSPMSQKLVWSDSGAILRRLSYGAAWAIAGEYILRYPTLLYTGLFTLGMQVFVTRLEHENNRAPGSFRWISALLWNVGLGLLGWGLVQWLH